MACDNPAKTDGKKSKLLDELTNLLGEEQAIKEYSKIYQKKFIEQFGDFEYNFKEEYKDDVNREGSEKIAPRVNDQGEPKLIRKTILDGNKITKYNQYYFQMADGSKMFLSNIKFVELNADQIEDTSKVLLNAFIRDNIDENFEDISLLDPSKILTSIDNFANNYIESVKDPRLKRRGNLILKYRDEFKQEVIDKLANMGLTYVSKIKNEKGEVEIEVGEEDKAGGINITESFEKNSKDTAPARIKLLLSVLPATQQNPKYVENIKTVAKKYGMTIPQALQARSIVMNGGDIKGLQEEDVALLKTNEETFIADSFLGKPKFADFDDVWSTLQPILADIVMYNSRGGEVKNVLEQMINEMKTMAKVKPWISVLIGRLERMDPNYQAQFVQTFSKSKIYFLATEVNPDTKKYKIINATATNSRDSKIRGEWMNNFAKIFLDKANNLKPEAKVALSEVKENINNRISLFKTAVKNQDHPVQVKIVRNEFEQIKDMFEGLGVDISNGTLIQFLEKLGGEEKATESVVDLYKSTIYMLENILDPNTKISEKGERINVFDNQNLIKALSDSRAIFEVNMADSNILANGGKSYFAYSNPSYLDNVINEWKRDKSGLERLASETWHKNSRWLNYFFNTEKDFKGRLIATNSAKREEESTRRISDVFTVLATSFKSTGKNDGKDPKNVSPIDALNDAIVKTLGYRAGMKTYASTILAADKGRKIELEGMPTFDSKIDFVDGDWYINQEVEDVFIGYFEDDYDRIRKVSNDLLSLPDEKKIVYYHTGKSPNGLKSQLFPSLSPENMSQEDPLYHLLYDNGLPIGANEDGVHTSSGLTDTQKEALRERIRGVIKNLLNENLTSMSDIGVIHSGDTDANLSMSDDILKSYVEKSSPIKAMSGDFLINSLINTIEYNKVFLGDPAYFKNMSDMIKRTPASYTDGLPMFLSETDDINFNQATIEGVEVSSRYVDLLLESLSKSRKPGETLIDENTFYNEKKGIKYPERYHGYTIQEARIAMPYDKIDGISGGVNTTDAQAWITPGRWKFIKQRLGQWSVGKESHQTAYDKMINGGQLTPKEMKLVAQPLKGVYFELNSAVPVYLKYSQAVLIPGVIKGGPMQRLYDKMTKDKDGKLLDYKDQIHEVVTIDGIKVGSAKATKVHNDKGDLLDDFELNSRPLKNAGWKLQQDLPTKLMHETMVGSQIQKNILAGIDVNAEYVVKGHDQPISGYKMRELVHNAISDLSNMGKQNLIDDFGIEDRNGVLTITNKEGLYTALIQEFKSRGGSDNIISALEKEMPFDAIPQVRNKVENVFMSMMNSEMSKVYTNGGSFIQISQFGFDSISDDELTDIKIVSDNYDPRGLKPPHVDPETGEYRGGQCFLPHTAILKLLPKGVDYTKLSGKELMQYIDPSALELISYRIPNQGMSSNDALEVVGILPPGMGDSIIAYDGVPVKTGSDFDIDKMYVMTPHLHFNKETNKIEAISSTDENNPLEAKQNELIELYSSILKSPTAYRKVMTSIDAEFFKEDIVGLFPESKLNDLSFYTHKHQMKTKFEYLSGKMGVAQTANQLVDHMLNKHENITFNGYIGIGAVDANGNTKFDNEYDTNEEYSIDDAVSAFLNAYVDIAKDPYVSRGNHNAITSGVTFMLLRAGVPIKKVNRFIAQTILSELVKVTKNSEGITSGKLKGPVSGGNVNANGYIVEANGLYQKEATAEDVTVFFEKYSNEDMENFIKSMSSRSLKEMSQVEIEMQSEALAVFNYLKDNAKFFSEAIAAAKTPDSGDMANLMIADNKYKMTVENNRILGFEDKFNGTFTGTYRKNSVDWVRKLVSDNSLFLNGNKHLQGMINHMSKETGRDKYSTDEEFIKPIMSSFYSYAMSGLNIFKNNNERFNELFVNLPGRIQSLKDSNSKNFLIKELEIAFSGGYNFLKINNKNKPKTYNNNIYRAWIDLMRSSNENEREIGNLLVKYAFSQSGFQNNLSQFFTYIPHEALLASGVSSHINNVHNEMDALILDLDFRDQMYRHNHDNPKIVPVIGRTGLQAVKNIHSSLLFAHAEDEPGSKGSIAIGKNDLDEYVYPQFVSVSSEDMMTGEKFSNLYEKVGMKYHSVPTKELDSLGRKIEKVQLVPIYAKTFKLGANYNHGGVSEYKYKSRPEKSNIPSNNVDDNSKETIEKGVKYLENDGIIVDPRRMIVADKKFEGLIKTEYEEKTNIFNSKDNKYSEISNNNNQVVEVKKESSNVNDYSNNSGGAKGSDMYWDKIGREYGVVDQNHITVSYFEKLSDQDRIEIEAQYSGAAEFLGRNKISSESYAGKLVRRDMIQANNASAIYGITELVSPKTIGRKGYVNKMKYSVPEGGTGYAVARGIKSNKPTYVFNQSDKYGNEIGWYIWNQNINDFLKTNTPFLSRSYAGIGSQEINDIGKGAIKSVYNKTFNEEVLGNTTEVINENDSVVDKSRSWVVLQNTPVYPDNNSVNTMRTKNVTNNNHHFGNPFTGSGIKGLIQMPDIPGAVKAYTDWINGISHQEVKSEQRKWILSQIEQGNLNGKTLLYMSEKGSYFSHADALSEIVNNRLNNLSSRQKSINIYAGSGENAELSNFAIRPFKVNVETPSGEKEFEFKSVEQAFHFYKAMTANNPSIGKKILNTTLGSKLRLLTNRSNMPMNEEEVKEWDEISKSVMLNLMYDSYIQNPDAAEVLINTGNAKITHNQDKTRWKTDFPDVVMTVRDMLNEEKLLSSQQEEPDWKTQSCTDGEIPF